jgi:site-specific DNA-methyltransferase (adenine-specific)
MMVIDYAKRYGFNHYIPLQFYKNYSPQVLKANMRVVGNTEYAILLYRNRLPKFNNNGKMVFNAIPYPRDTDTEKVHPTQKSVPLLRYLIELFTDEGDVVIDPCAGSGSTLLAAAQCGRKAYGFEIKKDFFKAANERVLRYIPQTLF